LSVDPHQLRQGLKALGAGLEVMGESVEPVVAAGVTEALTARALLTDAAP
jgi:hypothetical protein